jgi:HrpA-like RNA helicase
MPAKKITKKTTRQTTRKTAPPPEPVNVAVSANIPAPVRKTTKRRKTAPVENMIPLEQSSIHNKIGILDPEGVNPNPLTGLPYTEEYHKYTFLDLTPVPGKPVYKGWAQLPGYQNREDIIRKIENNQVILVIAGTGSGKTVLVPKFALHTLNYNGHIAVTNPKQTATRKNADWAAKCLDVQLGQEVGYKYRGSPDDSYTKGKTKLLFCTDGLLVARLNGNDPLLSDLDMVIIDEVHERTVNMDILMFLLKNVCRARPEFKVILISATVNEKQFVDYYSRDKDIKFGVAEASAEPNFPVEVFYEKNPLRDYKEAGVNRIVNILEKTEEGDILMFVNSGKEADEVCQLVNDQLRRNPIRDIKLFCTILASGEVEAKQKIATESDLYKNQPGGPYNRKLVIGTNLVESSVTFSGRMLFVVDNGRMFKQWYDPKIDSRHLDNVWISEAQAKQRLGRVGRTEPGTCYRLYTEDEYKKMKPYPETAIATSDLTEDLLSLLKYKDVQTTDKLYEFLNDLIEPPTKEYVESSLQKMISVGALDVDPKTKIGRINELGNLLANVKAGNIFITKALLRAYDYMCHREICDIIGMIEGSKGQLERLFDRPKKSDLKNKSPIQAAADRRHSMESFHSKHGDLITMLNIYQEYDKKKEENPEGIKEWCKSKYIKHMALESAHRSSKRTNMAVMDIIRKLRAIKYPQNNKNMNKKANVEAEDEIIEIVDESPNEQKGGMMMEYEISDDQNIYFNLNEMDTIEEEDIQDQDNKDQDQYIDNNNNNKQKQNQRKQKQRKQKSQKGGKREQSHHSHESFEERFERFCHKNKLYGLLSLSPRELHRYMQRGGENANVQQINKKVMKENEANLTSLFPKMKNIGNTVRKEDRNTRIVLALLDGFKNRVAKKSGRKRYRTIFPLKSEEIGVSRNSVLNSFKFEPSYIIYYEIFSQDGRVALENLTAVSEELMKKYDPELMKEIEKKMEGMPKNNKKPENRKFGDRKFGDRKFGDKKFGDRKFGDRKFGDRKFGDKKFGDRKFGDRKFGDKKYGDRKFGDKKFGDKKFGDNKFGDNKFGNKKVSNKKRSISELERLVKNKLKR